MTWRKTKCRSCLQDTSFYYKKYVVDKNRLWVSIFDTSKFGLPFHQRFLPSQGLRVEKKERVCAWDILEGHKITAPLSWNMFSAIRMERKPLWYEENHRLLKYHTHCLVKPSSYFLEPLPLPPEDMEPPMEKPVRLKIYYSSIYLLNFCSFFFLDF